MQGLPPVHSSRGRFAGPVAGPRSLEHIGARPRAPGALAQRASTAAWSSRLVPCVHRPRTLAAAALTRAWTPLQPAAQLLQPPNSRPSCQQLHARLTLQRQKLAAADLVTVQQRGRTTRRRSRAASSAWQLSRPTRQLSRAAATPSGAMPPACAPGRRSCLAMRIGVRDAWRTWLMRTCFARRMLDATVLAGLLRR